MKKPDENPIRLDLEWMERVITYRSLVDEEFLTTIIDHIKPSYFSDNSLSYIFEIVCDFYNRRKTLPNHTEIKAYLYTSEQKERFKQAVALTASVEKILNKDELYSNTERFIKERGIYETMLEVARDVGDGNIDTSKILDRFEKSCNVNLIHDVGLDLLNEFSKVKKDLKQANPTISTGFKWLDEKLGGGFQQRGRSMYVFAGETNIGKSIILGNFAVNAARQGKTALIVTLEMSELMYARRLSADISKIACSNLANDIDIVEAGIDNFKSTTGGRIIIKEFPPSTMTPRAIQSYIKKLQKRGIKVDLIVLDYINLLTSSKGKDSYERIKYIAEETRAMTYEFECPLVTVTQLNRTGYSISDPDLTTLSESYAMGATADFVGSLWQGEEDNTLGIMRMSILKSRFGRNNGTNAFKIDYSTLTISENADISNSTPEAEDVTAALRLLCES